MVLPGLRAMMRLKARLLTRINRMATRASSAEVISADQNPFSKSC